MTGDRKHARHGARPTLRIDKLTIEVRHRKQITRVVDDVCIDIWPGEIVGVIGESGSGKTLTALSALRLLPQQARVVSGHIELSGRPLLELSETQMRAIRGDRMALIPQDAMQSLNPTMRIGRQVGEPLELHKALSVKNALAAAQRLLASVHIPDASKRAFQYPHQFSGGMQQRAMIAMGLALDPELLIADEPTTALDVTIQAQVLRLLREIRDRSGASILFISHELGVVATLCDWVYVMRVGKVVEQGSVEEIFTRPRHEYTKMLLDATPSIHGARPEALR